jgi:F-type H+-transporting ATPase subunit b
VSSVFLNSIVLVIFAGDSYQWWNYPGFEFWKFLNLFVFITVLLLIHKRAGSFVREALRARRERIKAELEKAREERDKAVALFADVEARFQKLDSEVAAIKERSTAEAQAEKLRMEAATEEELRKIRENARREIESAGKAAQQQLRRFAAQESVRLAEDILTREIKPEDDARLTKMNLKELGGAPA